MKTVPVVNNLGQSSTSAAITTKQPMTVFAIARNHVSYYKAIIVLYSEVFDITILCEESIKDAIGDSYNVKWHLRREYENMLVFVVRSMSLFVGNRTVLMDEMYRFRRFLPLFILQCCVKPIIWQTIHNVNSWLDPARPATFVYWRRNLLRKLWLKKVSKIVCVGEAMVEQVRSLKWPADRVAHIPFRIPDRRMKLPVLSRPQNCVQFVVPGLVDNKRRDYCSLLKALDSLSESSLNKISFMFLGKISAETNEIVSFVERINTRCNRKVVHIWEKFVEDKQFNETMLTSDILVMNLRKEAISTNGTLEIYGNSKETGMPYLAADYALPLMVPKWYNTPKTLASQAILFDGYDQAAAVISKISSTPDTLYCLKRNASLNRQRLLKAI